LGAGVMIETLDIEGAGGGGKGGGGGSYNESPNTLRTISHLNILYLLSNGEIKGFPAGQDIRKFIYLNEIPILSATGTENYKGVSVDFRPGSAIQDAIVGSNGFNAGSSVSVAQKIIKGNGAQTRFITGAGADAIRVTLYTPALRTAGDNSLDGAKVEFKIELSVNGGPFVQKVLSSFEGKTTGGYARDYTIAVTGNGPWQVRVTRLTDDSLTDRVSNDLFWQSYSTLFSDRLIYANRSLLFMRVDAAYFSSPPRVAIKLSGMICSIPSNYNPVTRVYTGIWNGLFVRAATSNPAWIARECLVQTRWGLGRHTKPEQVDKWSFYRFAQYCDETVSDGWGGTEPRFEFKTYIRNIADALPALNNILVQCRAKFYWNGSQVMIVQDRPGIEPTEIYTQANVKHEFDKEGKLTQPPFSYQPAGLQAMHTVCIVKFFDGSNFGKEDVVRVTAADVGYPNDLSIYGDRVTEITLPGCISRGAATRHARWVLITERLEDAIVTFGVGQDGLLQDLGKLIAIQDEGEADIPVGGRIIAVTGNQLTLDRSVTANTGDELMIMTGGQLLTYQLTNNAVNTALVTVTGQASMPSPADVWLLDSLVAPVSLWKVLSVGESDNGYGVQAMKHSPDKYAIADNIGTFPSANSAQYANPNPPSNLEVVGAGDGSYLVGWTASTTPQVTNYILQKQARGSNTWQTIAVPPGYTDAEVSTAPGIYKFRVAAVSLSGRQSEWVTSGDNASFYGRIVSANLDGTITLDRDVILETGKTYQIETIVAGLPDVRPVTTPPSTTRTISTSPGYAGASASYDWGTVAALPPEIDNKASCVRVVGSGSVTVWSQPSYTGANQVLTAGIYFASQNQLSGVGDNAISSIEVAQNTTAILYEGEPGVSPQPASTWRLIEV
jgi:predicted phage tail protein